MVESSGAASVAAVMTNKVSINNKEVVSILSGGNVVDLDKLAAFLKEEIG